MNSNSLIDYFPNYLSADSLFTKMSQLGAPWTQEIGQDMDDAYFTMYSGIKNPSDFVLKHLNPDSDIANSLTIARIIYGMFGDNWIRLWEAYKTKYNPIDNYNVQEIVTTSSTTDRTIARNNDFTSTVDRTDTQVTEQFSTQNLEGSTSNNSATDSTGTTTLEHGEKIDKSAKADTYTYGFNSNNKVPTGSQIETGTDSHTGTDTTTTTDHSTVEATGTTKSDTADHVTINTDTTTKDVRADKTAEDTTDNTTGSEDSQRTRQGNVGQNSYQELLRQEFELWRWNFFTQVFEDVDRFLVLSVYSSCIYH